MLSDFDRTHIPEILADREGSHYEWTSAHVLRFLNTMLSKGIDNHTMAGLYELFPDELNTLLHYYGWPQNEIDDRINKWAQFNLKQKIEREFY